ncbi:AAA family ATPase [Halopseudomonas nanhaiensis]|uniref:bifunctional aminoglycoside phosphotransferase/ATP-binding protein n=1 Tax=Halopseudomonas nanhaiensis TaxID=2830842 RepID=UPI001CBBEAF5|nr:bifunctional aminoglycoside phosphotransferase/ATP-binding protein [Halopseudomonas nanhaiensis]UAW97946.1 AAA family ATPase [Halopseudomonas nanhaiensis]
MSQTLLNALQDPALYDHPVTGFTVMETHISWVLLTGDFVYKIKKPVDFGFIDYSTLERRAHFCDEEVRLNRRLAPELYLGVIPVRGSESAPRLDGDGPVIEYLVKTRQFRQEDLLGNMQRAGTLEPQHIDSLANRLATFHRGIDRAPLDSQWGEPEQIHAPVAQNFDQIRPLLADADDLDQLKQLELWAHTTFERLIPQLAQRKSNGFVRECHGDIYLDNVTLVDGAVTLFDCIEFNEAFRWIDVMSDVAFMAMDLEDRSLPGLSQRFVNAYLEQTGDYSGLCVLNYYKAYRAMVRAKVALLRLTQPGVTEAERQQTMERYRGYARLAESYTAIPMRFGLLTVGISGSGKSTLSGKLVEDFGAIRVRSDIERKRLLTDTTTNAATTGLYSAEATAQTYARLGALAASILASGYPAIIDATHLKSAQRQAMRECIELQGAPCLMVHCKAPLETIEGWIKARQAQAEDPSDADVDVARMQHDAFEPFTEQERPFTLEVRTDQPESVEQLLLQLRQKL